jgi:hypothetical protein
VCHIGNEATLYSDKKIKELLVRVRDILIQELDYQPNENDKHFLRVYAHLYE